MGPRIRIKRRGLEAGVGCSNVRRVSIKRRGRLSEVLRYSRSFKVMHLQITLFAKHVHIPYRLVETWRRGDCDSQGWAISVINRSQ